MKKSEKVNLKKFFNDSPTDSVNAVKNIVDEYNESIIGSPYYEKKKSYSKKIPTPIPREKIEGVVCYLGNNKWASVGDLYIDRKKLDKLVGDLNDLQGDSMKKRNNFPKNNNPESFHYNSGKVDAFGKCLKKLREVMGEN